MDKGLGEINSVFLTGATGVVGGHLLMSLLADTKTRVTCLVRAPDEVAGLARIESVLKAYEAPEERLAQVRHRVRIVLGDVGAEHLGLSDTLYKDVAVSTDVVVHCAAKTKLFSSYAGLAGVNVEGTQRIVDFALATPNHYLVHVSSYSVMGDRYLHNVPLFREEDLDLGQKFDGLAYQRSKFESERIVRAATPRGLKWIITRLGDVLGDSRTGAYPLRSDGLEGFYYDGFKRAIEEQAIIDVPLYWVLTPVEYVTAGLIHLALKDRTTSRTYHLSQPNPAPYPQVWGLLRDLGYSLRVFTQEDLRKGRSLVRASPVLTVLGLLPDIKGSSYPDTAFTRSILEPAGVHCPPIDQKLIRTYLDFCIRTGFLKAPE